MGLAARASRGPTASRTAGNHSCAGDLAALARAVLREPRLRQIVRRRSAVLPFPIKGGRLYLYNNNPLLRAGYRGTRASRRATRTPRAVPRRHRPAHGRRLGVVLLHSPDPDRRPRGCSTAAGSAERRCRAGAARVPASAERRVTPGSVPESMGTPTATPRPATARPTTCGSPPSRASSTRARTGLEACACATARCPGATLAASAGHGPARRRLARPL
jgi:hypothetical protein